MPFYTSVASKTTYLTIYLILTLSLPEGRTDLTLRVWAWFVARSPAWPQPQPGLPCAGSGSGALGASAWAPRAAGLRWRRAPGEEAKTWRCRCCRSWQPGCESTRNASLLLGSLAWRLELGLAAAVCSAAGFASLFGFSLLSSVAWAEGFQKLCVIKLESKLMGWCWNLTLMTTNWNVQICFLLF